MHGCYTLRMAHPISQQFCICWCHFLHSTSACCANLCIGNADNAIAKVCTVSSWLKPAKPQLWSPHCWSRLKACYSVASHTWPLSAYCRSKKIGSPKHYPFIPDHTCSMLFCSPPQTPPALHRRVWPPGMGMYSGRVVYFNDAVTESILRIPPGDLEGGDYTIVIQGMGGATQKLLVYLRVSLDLLHVGTVTIML